MTTTLPKGVADNIHQFTGRSWLLPKILNWLDDTDERLLLITGHPGTGKSLIMAWLAGFGPAPRDSEAYAQLTRLRAAVKAAHFCQASSRNIRPQAFAESIANQLTESVNEFSQSLAMTLADRLQITSTLTVESLAEGATVTAMSIGRIDLSNLGDELGFDRAFTEPLIKLYSDGYKQQLLILVDALDEALTYTGVSIPDLLSRLTDLPLAVRILEVVTAYSSESPGLFWRRCEALQAGGR